MSIRELDRDNLGYHLDRSALPGQRDWAALHESFSHFHAQPLVLTPVHISPCLSMAIKLTVL